MGEGGRRSTGVQIVTRRPNVGYAVVAFLALAAGLAATFASMSGCAPPPRPSERAAEPPPRPSPREVGDVMARVFEWQLARLEPPADPGWVQSTFMIGVVAAYQATGDERYLDAALTWAAGNGWSLRSPTDHADNDGAAQVYLDLSRILGDPDVIGPTREALGALADRSIEGRDLWSWSDALFMTPPALARLAAAIGDAGYLDAMDAWWWDATESLYDRDAHLYYRDPDARSQADEGAVRSAWGNRLFWSRGNGWVLAGIARLLPFVPDDYPTRGDYVSLFREMAATLASHQGEDGLWTASTLDPRDSLPPETSASALFCYALAWGVNEGILSPEMYREVVLKAWSGLVSRVGEDGKLGWVQPPGRRPALSFADGTAPYGAGAFLLAGSEMLRLK
jgi:unsaturated rhamnogalacturonyl hydrolase